MFCYPVECHRDLVYIHVQNLSFIILSFYFRMKTKLEGLEEEKSWKKKCQTVFQLLKANFLSVTQVKAGKIAKKAFSFIKR